MVLMKIMKKSRSLSIRLIFSFISVVVLTAVIIGFPVIWLIQAQLDNQAWSQVQQGAQAARALYQAQQKEVSNYAAITSQRPTLRNLLNTREWGTLEDYLTNLQSSARLDLLAVCSEEREVFAAPKFPPTRSPCSSFQTDGFHEIDTMPEPQIWLISSHQVDGTFSGSNQVIAGVVLDHEFAEDMQAQTGLEHTLWDIERPIATTLDSGTSVLASVIYQPVNGSGWKYKVDQQYYASRFSISDEEQLVVEVSLGTSNITHTQQRLAWILSGGILAVAASVSILGTLLARQISRPLVQLADTAEEFSRGDLETPVPVDVRVREVARVAQALEQARVELRESMADLRREKDWGNHLLSSIVEGIMIMDDDHRVTYFSRGAEHITGYTENELIGESCDDFFIPVEVNQPFSKILPAPGQRKKITVSVADDHYMTLAVTGAQFAPSEIQDAQVVLVFRDISEEEALHRLMGHFLANVSHEFRTPLSALAASIELLLDQAHELDTRDMQELLVSLHLGILRLRTLVDNLLESSSIEAGRFRVSPRWTDLGKIIAEVVQSMQPLLDKYNQHLAVELPAKIPVVHADAKRIEQVIINLISNANKYGPPDAEIILRARPHDDCVRVEVLDEGPGVHSDHRGDIFVRFVYRDDSHDTASMGAGLGLSVVKAIIEAHRGQVGVENRPGGGANFWFTLPREKE